MRCLDCGTDGVTEESPGHWLCPDCGYEFSGAAPPTCRTVAEWQDLLPKLVPGPLSRQEGGELHGGEGPEVIVSVDSDGIHLSGARIDWPHPHTPQILRMATQVLPLDTPAASVATAITRVWARRLGKLGWCVRCHQRFPRGHMLDNVCHGCATRYLHVIF